MGWNSYREDIEERMNESLRGSGDAEKSSKILEEIEVREFLELYTSPDLDPLHEVLDKKKRIKTLEDILKARDDEIEKIKHERDKYREQLQEAEDRIAKLRTEKHEAEEAFRKVWSNVPGSVIDAYS